MSTDEKQPRERQPWEQRDNESQQAFRAFVFYRDLGLDRSLTRAYRAATGDDTKFSNGTWDKWSSEHEWVERCRAYDVHMDSVRREAREREVADLEARRWAFERENQGLLENWVRNLDTKILESVTQGCKETKVEVGPDGSVVKREARVKFPALGALARAIEARNDTARQAVEGPRKRTEAEAVTRSANVEQVKAPANQSNEFIWISPPSEDAKENRDDRQPQQHDD